MAWLRVVFMIVFAAMAHRLLIHQIYNKMSPATVAHGQELNLLTGLKPIKHVISNKPRPDTMVPGKGWDLAEGMYTVRQVVDGCQPLLETVLHHLGEDPPTGPTAREMLIDNLASNLNLGTRESSLDLVVKDATTNELAQQALTIGKTLIGYIRTAKPCNIDPNYFIRSPCEGHLLKRPVAQLMFGPRSLGHLMMIYNEWLHQMVLLRDALLPFENYEEVVIPIKHFSGRTLGVRFTEQPRAKLLAELFTKQLSQKTLIKTAGSLFGVNVSLDNAYGFQYGNGSVVPSFLSGGRGLRLLTYIASPLVPERPDAAFVYDPADYYSSARSEITSGEGATASATSNEPTVSLNSRPVASSDDSGAYALDLHLSYGEGKETNADVGQISRGRRYAYVFAAKGSNVKSADVPTIFEEHTAESLLTKLTTGLIASNNNSTHVIYTNGKAELFGLLGRLYPLNIVVTGKGPESLSSVANAGKMLSDGPRFIISTDEEAMDIMPVPFVK